MHNTWHKVSRRIDIALWKWGMDEWVAYDYAIKEDRCEPALLIEWWKHSLGRMRKWNMTCHCGCNRKGRYKYGKGGLGESKKHLRNRKGWNKKKAEMYRFYAISKPEYVLYEFQCELEDDYHIIMERIRYEQEKDEIKRFGNEHGLV